MVGDGVCNDESNNPECSYDGGDCCSNPDGYCDDVKNNEACFFDGGDCCGSNVNGNQGWIADGWCDDINNNLACAYDGGDCCSIVRISLTNELLNAGFEYLNRDYEISIMPNGQTRWINDNYAIWFYSLHYPGYWLIGKRADIGELTGHMVAINYFYGLIDGENEWHYYLDGIWVSPTDPSDIQITCENK
jgi:hypothetical protein